VAGSDGLQAGVHRGNEIGRLAEAAAQFLAYLAEDEPAEDLVLAFGEGGAANLALPVDSLSARS
jgi:hypothetical protein